MSIDVAILDNDAVSCDPTPCSTPNSPKNQVKFLCSYGGKILPRPADAHLKYVGGETRVISVLRHILFQELVKKLIYLIDGEMILKYQVVNEDLDTLVTVKSNEDLRHMFDEIDQCKRKGSQKLRAFLFPANPVAIENQMDPLDPFVLEQRYIDAVNGIVRSLPKKHPSIYNLRQGSLVSSGCSSPNSPDSCVIEPMNNYPMLKNIRPGMHKVRSSPSLCSINVPQQNNSSHVHQLPPLYSQNYRQTHQPGYISPRPPVDFVAPEKLISVRSVGRTEGVRYQFDRNFPHYYNSTSRQNRGTGSCNKCIHFDNCSHCFDKRSFNRKGSSGMSPNVMGGDM